MHLLFTLLLACSRGSAEPAEAPKAEVAEEAPAPVSETPTTAATVERSCHPWPAQPFTTERFLEIKAHLERGDPAPDLTLRAADGQSQSLSSLWKERPLLIITGSTTCPVFRRHIKAIQSLEQDYRDRIHLGVVHGPQAHPATDPSPYRGDAWPLKFSRVNLARTWDERAAQGREVADRAQLNVWVDEMDTPFGCTYGTVPNGAFLIRTDGKVEAVHDWFDPPTMRGSLDALLGG